MKRPALCIGIPYVLGLTLGSLVMGAARLPLLGCLLVPGLTVLIWRRDLWKYVLLSTLSCLTACCVYWHADTAAAKQLRFAGQETVFTGSITDVTQLSGGYMRYTLRGAFPDGTPAKTEYLTNAALFSYGDTLTLSGVPERFASGYLYDNAGAARAEGMVLQFGFAARVTDFSLLQKPTLRSIVRSWRDTMLRRIRARMDEESGAMLTGMLFGDKSGLSRESRTSLYRMGIGHVLVVSGLHFDLLAVIAGFVLQKLPIGRKTGFVLMCLLAGLFVLAAGETISVRRACIMLLIRQSGRVFYRKADELNSLSIAMLVLGLENPFVVHSVSFWLSFAATFGIAVLAPYMTQKLRRDTLPQVVLADFFACCWCFLAVLPVSVLCFREISFLSPVSNTLLVPVCLGAMLLGVMALPFGCQGVIADTLLGGADVMNGWILRISRAVSSLSWTQAPTGSRLLLWTVLAGLALSIAVLLLSKNRRVTTFTVLCAVLVSAVCVQGERISKRNELRIEALGDGNSTLLVLHNGYDALLIDLTGQKTLAAYADACLTEEGISRVPALCLCKPSAKSVRSYASYLGYHKPDAVWLLQDKNCPALLGIAPQYADEASFRFHGADVQITAHGAAISYGGCDCLFTDVPPETAPEVLWYFGKTPVQLPDCGILFLPDGSAYSTADCTELTITESGVCRIRRLYGEN